MTRQELIKKMAEGADITKREAESALRVLLASVESELVEQGELSLVNFGKWSVVSRNARKGRNPRTGEGIEIPAKQVVRFRPGKKLAEAVR
jgi:DNA-binding protein HU-beta